IRAGRDQAADRLLGPAGDAGDRSVHRRIGEIELGLAHARLGQLRRGDRLLQAGRRLVGFPLADRAPVGKTLQALEILLRLLLARALLRERGARLLQVDLQRRTVDEEQPRAGLDRIAFSVELSLERAGHARPDLHFLRALGAGHRFEHDRHGLGRKLHGADRNRGQGRRLLLRIAPGATGRCKQHQKRNRYAVHDLPPAPKARPKRSRPLRTSAGSASRPTRTCFARSQATSLNSWSLLGQWWYSVCLATPSRRAISSTLV